MGVSGFILANLETVEEADNTVQELWPFVHADEH